MNYYILEFKLVNAKSVTT